MNRHLTLAAACAALCTATAGAQTVAVQDGDTVAGVGDITSIDSVAVNDTGSWLVESDTDQANTLQDTVLLRDGVLAYQEDQAVTNPAGATIDTYDSVTLNDSGNTAWNLTLDGTSGSSDDTGVFFNATLVIQEGQDSTAVGFTFPTPYRGFFECKINSSNDVLVMATVDDAAIPSTSDRALMLLDLDGSGTLLSETIVAKEGDAPAPLGGDTITDFETGPHGFALNDAGLVAYVADVTSSFGGSSALFVGSTMVARAGDPSPIVGRNWGSLSGRPLCLNNSGELLFRADLDGDTADDETIWHRSAGGTLTLIAREGDSITTPDGLFQYEDFGLSSPLFISDAGDILYFADWSDPDTDRDHGLIFNGQIIVQEGKTMIGGNLIERIGQIGNGVSDEMMLSSNGQWLIFECRFTGSVDAAVLIEPGSFLTAFCDGSDGALASCPCANPGAPNSGCDNAQSTGGVALSLVAQTTSPNGATLQGSGFSTMGAPTAIVIRSNALDPSSPVVFGDGLRCVSTNALVRLAATTAISGTSVHALSHGVMAGSGDFYYQVWYRNTPSTFCDPFAAFNLSNGLRLTW